MVPDKFNMVDMGGIDLIEMQGVEVPGLYEKLVESITQCRYQCLYNWMFDGVIIPPTYVQLEVNDNDEVAINEGVTVDEEDVVHIHSIEIIVEPTTLELRVTQNGEYLVPEGFDGFKPVTVEVIPPLQQKTITENGEYEPDEGYYGLSKVLVNVSGDFVDYDEHITDSAAYVFTGTYYPTGGYPRNITLYHLTPGYHYYIFRRIAGSDRFRAACFATNPLSGDAQVSGTGVLTFNDNTNYTGAALSLIGSYENKPYLVVDLGSDNPNEIPYVFQLEE